MAVGALRQMVGVGGASIISRRLGEKKMAEAEKTLGTSLLFTAAISLVLSILIALFSESILRLFGATDAIMPYAMDYVVIILIGFPVHAISMTGNSLISAEGNAQKAMQAMLIGTIVNIILDPIFIFGLDMGIQGAAIATIIGQSCSFVWIFLYYYRGKSIVPLRLSNMVIRWHILGKVLILGLPSFIQMAGFSLITTVINNILGTHGGSMAISTYGIIFRLLSFIFMPISGLAQGFQPIAGFNYGAGNYDRVRKVLYLALFSATAIAGVSYGIIMLFPGFFVGLFTTDAALINIATPALQTMALLTPIIGIQMISSIYFQAVGKGVPAILLGLSRQFIVLLPIVLILSRLYGVNGVWMSFPIADAISTIITVSALSFELRRLGTISDSMPTAQLKENTAA